MNSLNKINGLIPIYKEKGITSNELINKIKRKYKIKRIGHTGTIDKFASGVMIILFNEANKFQTFLMNSNKKYEVTFKFGYFTDTLDNSGSIFSKKDVNFLNKETFIKVINSFIGEVDQIPPICSSIKHKGKRLSFYLRSNMAKKINIKQFLRKITIFKINIIKYTKNEIKIFVECSKGTYIRALVRDICLACNNYGVVTELVRIQNNKFKLKNCKKWDQINFSKDLIKIDDFLGIKKILLKNHYHQKCLKHNLPIIYDSKNEYLIFYTEAFSSIYKKQFLNYFSFLKKIYYENI